MKRTTPYRSLVFLLLVSIGIFGLLNGIYLLFPDIKQDSLIARFSEAHFTSPGNDFGGGYFWLNTNSLKTPAILSFQGNGEKISCYRTVRGLYYNSQRGNRIWPLDQASLDMLSGYASDLTLTGGFYTTCDKAKGENSIFGYIKYTWKNSTSYLIAGAQLDYTNNSFTSTFTNNLQYFNSITPLGYIWDSAGGISFVGGLLSGDAQLINALNNGMTINEAFALSGNSASRVTVAASGKPWSLTIQSSGTNTAQDTMRNLLVQGNVLLSKSIDVFERKAFLGNLEKRTILLNGSDINSAQLINTAKKNAEKFCRGNTWGGGTSLPTSSKSNILCFKNNNLFIDLDKDSTKYQDKTIIVKSGNIILSGSMNVNSPELDLFIDKGNLYLPSNLSPSQYQGFTKDGFPGSGASNLYFGMFLKGNFLINGLLLAGQASAVTTFPNKLHLNGKITSLNTPTQPSAARIKQINSLLGSLEYNDYINLENTFVWYCGVTGIGSDSTSCAGNGNIALVPFVILNGNFSSELLK